MKKFFIVFVGLSILLLLYPPAGFGQKDGIELRLRLFTRVLNYIKNEYVEQQNLSELIEKAIDLMLHDLDSYSDLLTPREWEELEISTKGEFGGIGIQIGIRQDVLTVIAPIEGTPAYRAGLIAGDRIIEVEGTSTEGWTIEDAVKVLRGKPGTKVKIKIKRNGLKEPFNVTITREIIHIKAIPYASFLQNGIGYIRLADFSKNATAELKNTLDSLKEMGMQKLILDLRSNPGGLLNQAVEVADIFIEKDKDIVFTKTRGGRIEQRFKAIEDNGVYEEIPMTVLIDKGSASASEIVSGALQDWDRALVIGDTSFGKGSVQRLFPLEGEYRLRLTTAKYYIPSGRSIHKEKKTKKVKFKEEIEIKGKPDNEREEIQIFETLNLKRKVIEGHGVIPDVIVEAPRYSEFVQKILMKGYFFSFAVEYFNKNKSSKVNEKTLEQFYSYILEQEKKNKDEKMEITKEHFEKEKEDLKFFLMAELADKEKGVKGKYEVTLARDPYIKKALTILDKSEKREDVFVHIGK